MKFWGTIVVVIELRRSYVRKSTHYSLKLAEVFIRHDEALFKPPARVLVSTSITHLHSLDSVLGRKLPNELISLSSSPWRPKCTMSLHKSIIIFITGKICKSFLGYADRWIWLTTAIGWLARREEHEGDVCSIKPLCIQEDTRLV